MRSTLIFAVCAAALSLAACSDQHATEIKEGAKAAATDIKDAAREISNDPDVKEAGTALKESAKDAGAELKQAAGEATDAVQVAGEKAGDAAKEAGSDIKAGAKLVMGDGRMRWIALAFVLPQIVHRVFEGLLIPVFAKTVLENPSASAWLLTASNAGELTGAAILLKLASRFPGTHGWVKWGALGLLLTWALAFSTSLPLLLPLSVTVTIAVRFFV